MCGKYEGVSIGDRARAREREKENERMGESESERKSERQNQQEADMREEGQDGGGSGEGGGREGRGEEEEKEVGRERGEKVPNMRKTRAPYFCKSDFIRKARVVRRDVELPELPILYKKTFIARGDAQTHPRYTQFTLIHTHVLA